MVDLRVEGCAECDDALTGELMTAQLDRLTEREIFEVPDAAGRI